MSENERSEGKQKGEERVDYQTAYFQSIWSTQWKVRAIVRVKIALSRQQAELSALDARK